MGAQEYRPKKRSKRYIYKRLFWFIDKNNKKIKILSMLSWFFNPKSANLCFLNLTHLVEVREVDLVVQDMDPEVRNMNLEVRLELANLTN